MIDSSDYKAIIRDIEGKAKESIVSDISNVKNDGLYIILKFIKRDPILRDGNNNLIVMNYEFTVIGQGSSVATLIRIMNLEFRLVKDLNIMREGQEFSIAKGVQVLSGSKKLRYALMDNNEDPEENEVTSNKLSYKKSYELKIMFKN